MGGQLSERGGRHQRHLADLLLFAGRDGAAHRGHDGIGGRGALYPGSQCAPSQHGDDIIGGAGGADGADHAGLATVEPGGGPGFSTPGFRELAIVLVDEHQVQADGAARIADVVEGVHAAQHAGLVDEKESAGPGPVGLFDQFAGHVHGPDQEAGEGGEIPGGQRGEVDEDVGFGIERGEVVLGAFAGLAIGGHIGKAGEGELVGNPLDHAGEGALVQRRQPLQLVTDEGEFVA